MRAAFRPTKRKTDVQFKFDYQGSPIEVQARVRADGTLTGSVDYFAHTGNGRQLIYSVDKQIGTLGDAIAEFASYQHSLTPDEVFIDDPDRLGVGADGPIRNSARDQVKRMNDKDPMQTTRLGFRYPTPLDQEIDY